MIASLLRYADSFKASSWHFVTYRLTEWNYQFKGLCWLCYVYVSTISQSGLMPSKWFSTRPGSVVLYTLVSVTKFDYGVLWSALRGKTANGRYSLEFKILPLSYIKCRHKQLSSYCGKCFAHRIKPVYWETADTSPPTYLIYRLGSAHYLEWRKGTYYLLLTF